MPIAGMAHTPFLFWDGRKDSQWAQALGPLESPVEHGGNRTQIERHKRDVIVDRTSFTRFRVLQTRGRWGGVDPVELARAGAGY